MSEIALDLNKYIEFEKSVQLVLEALLHHTQVSRIYIFENVDNGLACSNTFEVCNTGVEPQISNLSYLPYEMVPYWEPLSGRRASSSQRTSASYRRVFVRYSNHKRSNPSWFIPFM